MHAGTGFERPAAPVANNWVEAKDAGVDSQRQEYRAWWTAFNDPVLTRLINLSYQQNLTLLTAGERVLQSRAQLGIAIGEFYPQQQSVSASVSLYRPADLAAL